MEEIYKRESFMKETQKQIKKLNIETQKQIEKLNPEKVDYL